MTQTETTTQQNNDSELIETPLIDMPIEERNAMLESALSSMNNNDKQLALNNIQQNFLLKSHRGRRLLEKRNKWFRKKNKMSLSEWTEFIYNKQLNGKDIHKNNTNSVILELENFYKEKEKNLREHLKNKGKDENYINMILEKNASILEKNLDKRLTNEINKKESKKLNGINFSWKSERRKLKENK